MKYTLIYLFCFLSFFSIGQTWNPLDYNPEQPGLELNPLKGLTPLYNVSNDFPHSLRGRIVGLDEIMFGFDPEDFDWSVFDDFLDTEGDKGNFAKLQVNVDMGFNRSDLPQFLKDLGVGHVYYDGQGTGDNQGVPSVVVDYNNEDMMLALETFIHEFGVKYNNDPRVFMVHYGLYGIFGEWGLGAGEVLVPPGEVWAMTEENQDRIAAAYAAAFENKKLLARFPENTPEPELVGYSDGLYFGASISDEPQYGWFFHRRLLSENADQNWKNHPIGGEVDPYLQGTLWANFPNTVTGDPDLIGDNPPTQNTEDIFNITRPTFLFQDWIFNENNITEASNPSMWANALKATKKTGYTFQIEEFRISGENGKPGIEVNILNKGLAPMYANWEVEFGYLDANGNVVSLGTSADWNMSVIQPDVLENYRSFLSDTTIPNGTHTFVMKVNNPLDSISDDAQPVRFANFTQDQDVDGWLTLGEATMSAGFIAELPRRAGTMFLIPSSATMGLQDQFQLTAQVFPGVTTNRAVTWSSNKPSTASVDENGLVTSYNIGGEVEITAFTQAGAIEKVAIITVNPYWNIPGRIEAEDFSSLNNAQVAPTPPGEDGGSVLGFINDETWMEYDVQVDAAATFTLDLRASSPFGIGVVQLLDSSGDTLTSLNLTPATDNSYDIYNTYTSGSFSLPAGAYTIRLDVVTSAININWLEFKSDCIDSDQDGVCDADDVCPNLDDALIGTPCDDNNDCTTNDIYTTDCGCEGTFQDADQDGICDADDLCPNLDDALIGTPCDDNDACTINDLYTADCGCEGTFQDTDQDGVCDEDDLCPSLDDALIGTPCDDNNACTINDVYTPDCDCKGTLQDTDQDGVCDADDLCPNLDDALIGTPCDDNDACTINDVYTADCGCVGTLQDTDQDGVCDADDLCPNLDDTLIGTPCDDQDPNTSNDIWTTNCLCEGEVDNSQISFLLIDADADVVIRTIIDGDVINVNEVGWNLNIVASTDLPAGSVKFSLNNRNNFRTDNFAPFAMAGNRGSNFFNWNPTQDAYTVAATVYSEQRREGDVLGSASISFTVIYEDTNNDNIQFQLVDSETNLPIRYLTHDDVIDLSETGSNLNIIAETPTATESVIFSVNRHSRYRAENVAPYALAGDTNGNFNNWDPQLGTYHIKARAYDRNRGRGNLLDHSTIRLTIINTGDVQIPFARNSVLNNNEFSAPNMKVFPNPFEGEVFLEVQGVENGKGEIKISDLSGRTVSIQQVEHVQNQRIRLQLETLESGIYILNYLYGDKMLVQKIIKN